MYNRGIEWCQKLLSKYIMEVKRMEEWKITINQEVSNEVCSDLVAELWRKMKKRNIAMDDNNNPLVILSNNLNDLKNDIVGDKYVTNEQFIELKGYFKIIRSYIQQL